MCENFSLTRILRIGFPEISDVSTCSLRKAEISHQSVVFITVEIIDSYGDFLVFVIIVEIIAARVGHTAAVSKLTGEFNGRIVLFGIFLFAYEQLPAVRLSTERDRRQYHVHPDFYL